VIIVLLIQLYKNSNIPKTRKIKGVQKTRYMETSVKNVCNSICFYYYDFLSEK